MINIQDTTIEDVSNTQYNASFFASGYEARCTSVLRELSKTQIGCPTALSFHEYSTEPTRIENDKFFLSLGIQQLQASSSSQDIIYITLNEILTKYTHRDQALRILVDYSAMSKLWLSAFISWARLVCESHPVTIDFAYTLCRHITPFEPLSITHALPLPWFEGSIKPTKQSISFFGLGFDGLAPLCVLDSIESDFIFSFYASPATLDEYADRAISSNSKLIQDYSTDIFALPIHSVSTAFTALCENVSNYVRNSNINLIPMGPKPLTLASLLTCCRYTSVTFLNISGTRANPSQAEPIGDFVVTSVSFT